MGCALIVDDFLGLAVRDLSEVDLLVLVGESGSGKSTLARWLLETHPHLAGPHVELSARPLDWRLTRAWRGQTVLVDEIASPWALLGVARLLWHGNRVVLASHVGGGWFAPLGWLWSVRVLATDRDGAKLARWMDARGVRWTPAGLRRFVGRFGATYTDLEILLERHPVGDLDRALARFDKLDRIRLESVAGELSAGSSTPPYATSRPS